MRPLLTVFDGADLYLNIIYVGLLISGIDLILLGEQETTIDNNLPHTVYAVWVLLHFAVPVCSWAGQIIHYRRLRGATGRMAFGWELRWAADAGFFLIVVTAIIATTTVHGPDWKRHLVLYIMCGVLALVYTMRDIGNIVYRECATRQVDRVH
jgi:hypothetical protein